MGRPTEKMLKFAEDIAKKTGETLTEEIKEDFEKTKEFINNFKDKVKKSLSEKQIAIIEKNGDESIKKLLEDTSKNYQELKEWLNNYFKNLKK